MKPRAIFQIMLIGLIALIITSVFTALAAGIDIAPSNADVESIPISAEDIKPFACSALYLTNIVRGAGTITGTNGNDLIIGSTSADTIDGLGGDDCILGDSGDDLITGGDGTDICLGGPGADTFTSCETQDE